MNKQRNVLFTALLFVGAFLLCCSSNPQVEVEPGTEVIFKPIQLHWNAPAETASEKDSLMNENCVILVTGRLMEDSTILASQYNNLEYNATYSRDPKNAENIVFSGVCSDSTRINAVECNWTATCNGGKVVVIFHNGH